MYSVVLLIKLKQYERVASFSDKICISSINWFSCYRVVFFVLPHQDLDPLSLVSIIINRNTTNEAVIEYVVFTIEPISQLQDNKRLFFVYQGTIGSGSKKFLRVFCLLESSSNLKAMEKSILDPRHRCRWTPSKF